MFSVDRNQKNIDLIACTAARYQRFSPANGHNYTTVKNKPNSKKKKKENGTVGQGQL